MQILEKTFIKHQKEVKRKEGGEGSGPIWRRDFGTKSESNFRLRLIGSFGQFVYMSNPTSHEGEHFVTLHLSFIANNCLFRATKVT